MPVKCRFTDGGRGFVVRHTGTATGDEILRVIDEIFLSRDITAVPVFHGLIDTRGMSGESLSAQDVKKVADLQVIASRRMPGTATVIAVCAEDNAVFGLSRMWQTLVDPSGWETQVFRDREEAVSWLKGRVADKFGFHATVE